MCTPPDSGLTKAVTKSVHETFQVLILKKSLFFGALFVTSLSNASSCPSLMAFLILNIISLQYRTLTSSASVLPSFLACTLPSSEIFLERFAPSFDSRPCPCSSPCLERASSQWTWDNQYILRGFPVQWMASSFIMLPETKTRGYPRFLLLPPPTFYPSATPVNPITRYISHILRAHHLCNDHSLSHHLFWTFKANP